MLYFAKLKHCHTLSVNYNALILVSEFATTLSKDCSGTVKTEKQTCDLNSLETCLVAKMLPTTLGPVWPVTSRSKYIKHKSVKIKTQKHRNKLPHLSSCKRAFINVYFCLAMTGWKEAMDCFDRALPIMRQERTSPVLPRLLCYIGSAYFRLSKLHESEK